LPGLGFLQARFFQPSSNVIRHLPNAMLPRAMGAAVKRALGLDTVADDFALAVLANWSQSVNRALEAVERVSVPGSHHLK
jgi:hypothetical protein